jgi:hypothetical protein
VFEDGVAQGDLAITRHYGFFAVPDSKNGSRVDHLAVWSVAGRAGFCRPDPAQVRVYQSRPVTKA